MIVEKINIPALIHDNDAAYINHVQYTVEAADPSARMIVMQKIDSIGFRVEPSDSKLKQEIIRAVRKSHYKLGLKIDFSKSVNSVDSISFWTCFHEN